MNLQLERTGVESNGDIGEQSRHCQGGAANNIDGIKADAGPGLRRENGIERIG